MADPRTVLRNMAQGYRISGVVYAVARFGIADQLATAQMTGTELAAAVNVQADPLERFLRAAASLGLLASDETGRYRLTPVGEFLRSDTQGSMRDSVLSGSRWQREAWRHDAIEAALTGPGPGGWRFLYSKPWFDWLAERPEEMEIFQRGMASSFAAEPAAIIAAFDFSPFQTIMDLGGGNGLLLSTVLGATPNSHGMLVDLPGAIAAARREEGGPLPRCHLLEGDFFRPLPAQADLIMMKRVIHDWDDPEASEILKNARVALKPGGRIVVFDAVMADGDAEDPMKLLDLHMLLLPGGRQRTRTQFASLFQGAGLTLLSARSIRPDLSVMEGQPN